MQPPLAYQQAQARQNFMRAHDRPGCRNCTQGQEHAASDAKRPNWLCALGKFTTTAI